MRKDIAIWTRLARLVGVVWAVEVGTVDEDEEEEGITLEAGTIMGMGKEEGVAEAVTEEEDIKAKASLASLAICSAPVNKSVFPL